MPLILAFLSLFIGFLLAGACFGSCYYKGVYTPLQRFVTGSQGGNGFKKAIRLTIQALVVLLILATGLLALALILIFGALFAALFFTIFILPFMLIFPVICCKKNSAWQHQNPKTESLPQKMPSTL